MNGTQHYQQGEALLARCTEYRPGEERAALATEANAHFLAALVACLATSQHPESVAWDQAVNHNRSNQ